ncbi:hypothetical protein COO60DRAFT_266282 [Scenedesmus sp. NREL 46B-D3]|nr:hypothetical protein COO60DRAFT_266282 [Scenedesmus sp. NREL 46B-D3]
MLRGQRWQRRSPRAAAASASCPTLLGSGHPTGLTAAGQSLGCGQACSSLVCCTALHWRAPPSAWLPRWAEPRSWGWCPGSCGWWGAAAGTRCGGRSWLTCSSCLSSCRWRLSQQRWAQRCRRRPCTAACLLARTCSRTSRPSRSRWCSPTQPTSRSIRRHCSATCSGASTCLHRSSSSRSPGAGRVLLLAEDAQDQSHKALNIDVKRCIFIEQGACCKLSSAMPFGTVLLWVGQAMTLCMPAFAQLP